MAASSENEIELLTQLKQNRAIWERLAALSDSSNNGSSGTINSLGAQKQLRSEFPEDLVRAALALQELRTKAAGKFSLAERMWLDRQGFEQATPEAVAQHKAKRFSGEVFDLCCGIGSDTVAMARHCDVVSVDKNPAACLRTTWNAEVYNVANRVQAVCADVETINESSRWVHVDPDRRGKGQGRSIRLEHSVPGIEYLQQLTQFAPGGAIKVSPASNFMAHFDDQNVEFELVSLNGECKETTIWFGGLATTGLWRATVLPANETITGHPLDLLPDVADVQTFVYDPDPAVVRAGLVDRLAEDLGLQRLDDEEEFLTSTELVTSPFVRAFRVLGELPNNIKEIKRHFSKADFGQVEIKCRHLPIQAEAIRRKLKLEGDQAGVLIFARLHSKARALVCERAD